MSSKSKTKKAKSNASANKIKQIRNCTHMAVTHLAEKLKPITPQLELLHDMCFHFMSLVHPYHHHYHLQNEQSIINTFPYVVSIFIM